MNGTGSGLCSVACLIMALLKLWLPWCFNYWVNYPYWETWRYYSKKIHIFSSRQEKYLMK
jgi:hypothetical protein